LRGQGLEARLAGIEAINVPVTELADTPEVEAALVQAARRLGDAGARGLVLGCAGMTPFAERLRRKTDCWVIDPVIAAASLAIAAAVMGN
jgi:allantoin racemase